MGLRVSVDRSTANRGLTLYINPKICSPLELHCFIRYIKYALLPLYNKVILDVISSNNTVLLQWGFLIHIPNLVISESISQRSIVYRGSDIVEKLQNISETGFVQPVLNCFSFHFKIYFTYPLNWLISSIKRFLITSKVTCSMFGDDDCWLIGDLSWNSWTTESSFCMRSGFSFAQGKLKISNETKSSSISQLTPRLGKLSKFTRR